MFDKRRNTLLNPIQLKRHVNGKFRTLGVIPASYSSKNHSVLLFDKENQEFFQCQYINNEFLKATKILDLE